MQWADRVYGTVEIKNPDLLHLIECPTFQRLKGVRQAGPSALAFPFKNVTRYEHSLGVHQLLRELGADRREQVAGLLHDISHTAFSHAVDFLYTSEEQNHHEQLKAEFLKRPDLAEAICRLGYQPEEFVDDSIFPLLEQPLPWLCADRLDYFFRDGTACGVLTCHTVERFRSHLAVVDQRIVFTDYDVAEEAVERFAVMNSEWWASPTEAYIYNEFAKALRIGFEEAILQEADLLEDDDHVLRKLLASKHPIILEALATVEQFDVQRVDGYIPVVIPKVRWLDPPVAVGNSYRQLSEFRAPTR